MQSVTKLIHQPTTPLFLKKRSDRILWFSWVKGTMPLFIAKPQCWESAQNSWDYAAFNNHAFWLFPDFLTLSFAMCAWQWVLSAIKKKCYHEQMISVPAAAERLAPSRSLLPVQSYECCSSIHRSKTVRSRDQVWSLSAKMDCSVSSNCSGYGCRSICTKRQRTIHFVIVLFAIKI